MLLTQGAALPEMAPGASAVVDTVMHVGGPGRLNCDTPLTQTCAVVKPGAKVTLKVAVPCPLLDTIALAGDTLQKYPLVPGTGHAATE